MDNRADSAARSMVLESASPPWQDLELKRLETVATAFGETSTSLGLNGSAVDQVHLLNRYLGNRLKGTSPRDRAVVQSNFVVADRVLPTDIRMTSSSGVSPAAQSVIATGCAELGQTLREDQVQAIHAHLQTKRMLLSHVPYTSNTAVNSLAEVPPEHSYATYEFLDLWSSPHVMELATQDRFLDLAQAYLGCTPTLYSINAFWSLPNRLPHPYSQVFHRDHEDFRSLVVFTLLTPVDAPEEGAHYYVEKSHDAIWLEAALRAEGIGTKLEYLIEGPFVSSMAMRLFGRSARRFQGPAGYSFCGDGYGLHRALVPHSKPRLLMWFRFGNFFNEAMYATSMRGATRAAAEGVLARIPNTPRHRYAFRYVIDALSAV